jgi:hypothetical protein
MSSPLKKTNSTTSAKPSPAKVHLPQSPMQWVVFVLAAVVLVALIGAIIWKTTDEDAALENAMAKTVVTCGDDFQLSNTELNYYFWSEYFYLLSQAGEELPESLDPTVPLDEQMYDQDQTWQDVLLEQALTTVQHTMSLVFEAEDAGFTMSDQDKGSLGQVLSNFEHYALAAGFTDENGEADLEAYLADSYGPGASLDSFLAYLENSYLATAYSDQLRSSLTFTDQEISDYYDLYAEDYAASGVEKDDTSLRSIRLILIQPTAEDEASWEEARASVQTLLDTWQAESGSEEDFAEMAKTRSAHSSAADGGLVADLAPADLSEELAAWVFDGERQPGDTEILKMDAGWAALYYVGPSERTVWQKTAEEDLRWETYQNNLMEILSKYTFEVNREAVVIQPPTGIYDGEKADASGTND